MNVSAAVAIPNLTAGLPASPIAAACGQALRSFQSQFAVLLPLLSGNPEMPADSEDPTDPDHAKTAPVLNLPVQAAEVLPWGMALPLAAVVTDAAPSSPPATAQPAPEAAPIAPSPAIPGPSERKLEAVLPMALPALPAEAAEASPAPVRELAFLARLQSKVEAAGEPAPAAPADAATVEAPALTADAGPRIARRLPDARPESAAGPQPAAAMTEEVPEIPKPEASNPPAGGDDAPAKPRDPGPEKDSRLREVKVSDGTPRLETAAQNEAAALRPAPRPATLPAPDPSPAPARVETSRPEHARPAASAHSAPEISAPAPRPTAPAGPAHDISLRLSDSGRERVELRVSDRGGEVRVAVHTADANLAGSLRENLSDLVSRLEQGGFHAETWRPAQTASSSMEDDGRGGGSGQQDAFGGSRQGQPQHGDGGERRQQEPERARWIEEIERSSLSWLQP